VHPVGSQQEQPSQRERVRRGAVGSGRQDGAYGPLRGGCACWKPQSPNFVFINNNNN
jgi:hypothetical protein